MDLANLTIQPEILQQFLRIYHRKNGKVSVKNVEKAFRKVVRRAREIHLEHLDHFERSTEKPTAYYLSRERYLIVVLLDPEPAIIAVTTPGALFGNERAELIRQHMALIEKETVPPIDLACVRFTNHALKRFKERFPLLACGGEEVARALLAEAKEDGAISSSGRVIRLINHHLEEVRYFMTDRCRFVVKEYPDGTFEVLTIEYAHLF